MVRIVILGAGFGGLSAAMKLGRMLKRGRLSDCEVTLIDKNDYHTYTPTLYEAATTSKDMADYIDLKSIVTLPIKTVIKGLPIRFVQNEAIEIKRDGESGIRLKNGQVIPFDYLLVAPGSVNNFFQIPGLQENALELKTFADSMKVRDTVWNEMNGRDEEKELNIVVGGGGSTGVELAGELRGWINMLNRKRPTKISIIEANPTVLFGFDERVVKTVTKRLNKIGVEILAGNPISSVSGETKKITLKSGAEIPFDILVWTGGVTANPIIQTASLQMKSGRVEAANNLVCITQTSDLSSGPMVFAIGDVVCVMDDKTGRPVPMVARAAINQGEIAAINVEREIKKLPHAVYKPGSFPYVIPIGGKYAVAKLGNLIIKGFWGWILKGLVELNYLFSIMPKLRAIRIWLKGLMLFIKNERLG